jgi:hypothetical protein
MSGEEADERKANVLKQSLDYLDIFLENSRSVYLCDSKANLLKQSLDYLDIFLENSRSVYLRDSKANVLRNDSTI